MTRQISRRQFIEGSLMLAASALLSGCAVMTKSPVSQERASANNEALGEGNNRVDVIVIGAGVAGLAAAGELRASGFKVIVIEGRERIGGRLWTDRSWPGVSVDLGASWIHGIEDNPVAELVKRWEIASAPFDYDSRVLYDGTGKRVSDEEEDAIDDNLNALMEFLEEKRDKLTADIPFKREYDAWASSSGLSGRARTGLDFAVSTEIEHEYAADISELSLLHWDEGDELKGGDTLVTGGYDRIASRLAEGLDIRLNHIVGQIEWNDSGVVIETKRGSFRAERAVVTLPLGVLKKGKVAFSPGLPERKKEAIRKLGMGVLNKLYLRFPKPFWERNSSLLGYMSRNKGEWAEFINLEKYTGKPVLLGFNAGAVAQRIEGWTDERAVGSAMDALRSIYGHGIPEPESWKITRWAADPFTYGAYSFLTAGAGGSDIEELAKPVDDRLFFAGEATSSRFAATVHGAYLSGLREAGRIVKLRR